MSLLAVLSCLFAPIVGGDIELGQFKAGSYGHWKVEGPAFVGGPALGSTLKALEIQNARGAVITSERDGDGAVGKLTSPKFLLSRKFLSFRIGGGDYEYSTCVNLLVDGKVVRSSTGSRSDRLSPASWDVSAWKGRQAQIEVVDQARGDWGHINVEGMKLTDRPEAEPTNVGVLYSESLRPQFHVTARQWTVTRLNPGMRQEGWINDLNGLLFHEGEYHLFAQRWAKCWLHFVSKDLLHWKELQPAFWEESEGSGVQSGTIVVDTNNTSGLGKGTMVAFWSRFDNRSQCISTSSDKGRTWTLYKDNPLFTKPERDPKVFWYEPAKHWVMMMYGDGKYHTLTSPNLLQWTETGHSIPDCFECPDFFQLPVDGDSKQSKWVLIQGDGRYSVGSFDGQKFTEETPRMLVDIGPNFYATQSWDDGRRIQAAWMRGSDFPDMPFNQQVSFPCELQLRSTPEGPRLVRFPIREIGQLLDKEKLWRNLTLKPDERVELVPDGHQYRLITDFTVPPGSELVFDIRGDEVVVAHDTLVSGSAKGQINGEIHHLEILIDRASIETFVNGGVLSSTRFVLPQKSGLAVKARGAGVVIKNLKVFPVKSVWH